MIDEERRGEERRGEERRGEDRTGQDRTGHERRGEGEQLGESWLELGSLIVNYSNE